VDRNTERFTLVIELAGRVVPTDGTSPAGLAVRVEPGRATAARGMVVRFAGGPLRVGADGRFHTPPVLLAGMRYRAVIEAEGRELAVSGWTDPPGEGKIATLPDLVVRALNAVSGRVVDRQGKPIAGARVLQSDDGPARTEPRTDADGRFRLPGYSVPHGLVFAHAPGFRFGGRLARAGARPPYGWVSRRLRRRIRPTRRRYERDAAGSARSAGSSTTVKPTGARSSGSPL
jgi:hypothetical protein